MPFHGWNAKVRSLGDIAASQALSLRNLVSKIDLERKHGNLSSAVQLFVPNHYKQRCYGMEVGLPA
jgi:predicted DNA-binding ribbon-helix-helix protein